MIAQNAIGLLSQKKICPNCSGKNLHLSHRKSEFEFRLSAFSVRPFRCGDCQYRFWRFVSDDPAGIEFRGSQQYQEILRRSETHPPNFVELGIDHTVSIQIQPIPNLSTEEKVDAIPVTQESVPYTLKFYAYLLVVDVLAVVITLRWLKPFGFVASLAFGLVFALIFAYALTLVDRWLFERKNL